MLETIGLNGHAYGLLQFCWKANTYLGPSKESSMDKKFFVAAMGSPLSTSLQQIFSWRTLKIEPWPHHHALPKSGKGMLMMLSLSSRFDQKQTFLELGPQLYPPNNIQFTSEDPGEDGSIPFLDMLIFPDGEGRL